MCRFVSYISYIALFSTALIAFLWLSTAHLTAKEVHTVSTKIKYQLCTSDENGLANSERYFAAVETTHCLVELNFDNSINKQVSTYRNLLVEKKFSEAENSIVNAFSSEKNSADFEFYFQAKYEKSLFERDDFEAFINAFIIFIRKGDPTFLRNRSDGLRRKVINQYNVNPKDLVIGTICFRQKFLCGDSLKENYHELIGAFNTWLLDNKSARKMNDIQIGFRDLVFINRDNKIQTYLTREIHE